MIEIVTGDLLEAKEKYLCHQCNCVTNKSAHLAKDVFTRHPYADIYVSRTDPDLPGSIRIMGDGLSQRYVVNLLGQYFPGKPKYPESNKDGTIIREKYFRHCLYRLAKIINLESVAFPWKIGCGSAGGNWEHYLGDLNNFANYVEKTQNAKVFIYRRECDE